jgi:hypothetical protein
MSVLLMTDRRYCVARSDTVSRCVYGAWYQGKRARRQQMLVATLNYFIAYLDSEHVTSGRCAPSAP